jgi:uncharacterized lipoprotein YmbA
MIRLRALPALLTLPVVVSCSSTERFYQLSASAAPLRPGKTHPIEMVALSVTLPELLTRAQMVLLASPNRLDILEKERWAEPLEDQVRRVLAEDLEQRIPGLMVTPRVSGRPDATQVRVDVVSLLADRWGKARLEARWTIADVDAATPLVGSCVITVPLGQADYEGIAQAYSSAVGELSERIADGLAARPEPRLTPGEPR